MTVKDVLRSKGSALVETVNEDEPVCNVMSKLVEKKIGSLLVLNRDGLIVGIVSEKECLAVPAPACAQLDRLPASEIMIRDIIICQPDDDIELIENVMTQNRIRHLPVIDDKKLVGLISIGDVVKAQTREIHVENRYLRDYIMGKYPG